MQFWRYTFFLGFLFLAGVAVGQDEDAGPRRGSRIIDDTTKQVYGPKTSRYYYEEDVFLNKQTYHLIDTAIRGFYRYTYVQRNENLYQDLGNIGTAMHPIYYQTPANIGVSPGFTQYDLIWDTEKVRYFDTKSPYSNMWVMLGGGGRSMTKASYSRNINPRWNFGFDYRGLFIDKQIQKQGKGDRQVRGVYYDLYTTYQSKDSTYRLFANLQRNRHQTDENGGIVHTENTKYSDYFQTNVRNYLTDAASTEIRINLHLFHQYEIGKALQVYHVFDRFRQGNSFSDVNNSFTRTYYDYETFPEATQVVDRSRFRTVRNELGLKGNLAKLYYNGYYAIRNYSQTRWVSDTVSQGAYQHRGAEHYLGGRMALRLDSIGELSGWVEVLQTGNYRVEGHLKSEWFEASVKQMQYAPSYMLQGYIGGHDAWNNNFSDINVTEFAGAVHYKSRVFSISPGVTFTRLGNYAYFRKIPDYDAVEQLVTPYQSSTDRSWVAPEVRLQFTMLRHVYLRGRAIYTKILKDEKEEGNHLGAIQVPELFVNGELSYENIFFNGNLDMQAGVNVHWNSSYRALGYDSPTQQFYVTNTLKVGDSGSGMVPSFPLVEVFFATRIKRGRIFLKYHNLVQSFTKQGYMPTPYYRGQGSILDFGFDWSFYD